jgi:hypothetical protein
MPTVQPFRPDKNVLETARTFDDRTSYNSHYPDYVNYRLPTSIDNVMKYSKESYSSEGRKRRNSNSSGHSNSLNSFSNYATQQPLVKNDKNSRSNGHKYDNDNQSYHKHNHQHDHHRHFNNQRNPKPKSLNHFSDHKELNDSNWGISGYNLQPATFFVIKQFEPTRHLNENAVKNQKKTKPKLPFESVSLYKSDFSYDFKKNKNSAGLESSSLYW